MPTKLQSAYRSLVDQRTVQDWCATRLAKWPLEHERRTLDTTAGRTHVTVTGRGTPTVVLVPGTSANVTTYFPLVEMLTAQYPTMVVDVPGQPGLSSGERIRRDRSAWYGSWLCEVLDAAVIDQAVVVGHSLGGSIALACDSPRIAARVLIGTAGLVRLRVDAATLAATAAWMVHPTNASSTRFVRRFLAPAGVPPAELVEWYTIVARHCRTSLAPPALPQDVIARARRVPRIVASGHHDVFAPPDRLRRPAADMLGVQVTDIVGTGHFVTDERPEAVVALVRQAQTGL